MPLLPYEGMQSVKLCTMQEAKTITKQMQSEFFLPKRQNSDMSVYSTILDMWVSKTVLFIAKKRRNRQRVSVIKINAPYTYTYRTVYRKEEMEEDEKKLNKWQQSSKHHLTN